MTICRCAYRYIDTIILIQLKTNTGILQKQWFVNSAQKLSKFLLTLQLTDYHFEKNWWKTNWELHVCRLLRQTFPEKWIRKNGPISWLTKYHFPGLLFAKLQNITDLKQKITNRHYCWGYATVNMSRNWVPSWCDSCNK